MGMFSQMRCGVLVLNSSTPSTEGQFELVIGHRRHRACLELGILGLAAIEEAADVSLFEQMERENRGCKNLSAREQGDMYRKALNEGLYPSLRRLSESLGVDVALVSKSVTMARLPDVIVAAFDSLLDIQFRWAAPLAEAVQKDPDAILARAKSLATCGQRPPGAARVFEALISGSMPGVAAYSPLRSKSGKEGRNADHRCEWEGGDSR